MSSARWVEVPEVLFGRMSLPSGAGAMQVEVRSVFYRGAGKWPLNEVRDDLDRIRALDKTRVTTPLTAEIRQGRGREKVQGSTFQQLVVAYLARNPINSKRRNHGRSGLSQQVVEPDDA